MKRLTPVLSNRLTVALKALFALGLLFTLSLTQPADAARPDAPKYARRGPFIVGTREFTIPDAARPLSATVWYPALNPDNKPEEVIYRYGLFSGTGRAITDAPVNTEKGAYPLIVFAHGLGGFRYQSVFYTEHLASQGFVVIAVDHPGSTLNDLVSGGAAEGIITSFAHRPLEVLREIAFVETLTQPGGALAGAVYMDRVAVTGHSFGGYTTMAAAGGQLDLRQMVIRCAGSAPTAEDQCALTNQADKVAKARGLDPMPEGVWPATTDSRIKAAVALAPSSREMFGVEGLASFNVPLMVIVGTQDTATPADENGVPYYEGVASREKALALLELAGHYVFVEKCPPIAITLGRAAQCSDLVWDMDRAHDLINHMATAFFRAVLYEDSDARAFLKPDAVDFLGVDYRSTF